MTISLTRRRRCCAWWTAGAMSLRVQADGFFDLPCIGHAKLVLSRLSIVMIARYIMVVMMLATEGVIPGLEILVALQVRLWIGGWDVGVDLKDNLGLGSVEGV